MQTDDRGTDLRPPLKRGLPLIAILILLVLVAALARLVWKRGGDLADRPSAAASAPAASAAAAASAAPAASAPASGPAYPLPVTEAPEVTPADLPSELEALIGSKAVVSFLQLDEFPRRVVATVDNLARPQAPSRLWPVQRTSERFKVIESEGRTVIDPDNALRYAPLVLLAETVNLKQLVALYRRAYPTLQNSYEELGYPGRHFNDRLVEVIDHLLAAPEPQGPLEVVMPTINTPSPPPRPWVLYQFADPQLDALSAGQKIMVRIGAVNARRLKARLSELRTLLVAQAS